MEVWLVYFNLVKTSMALLTKILNILITFIQMIRYVVDRVLQLFLFFRGELQPRQVEEGCFIFDIVYISYHMLTHQGVPFDCTLHQRDNQRFALLNELLKLATMVLVSYLLHKPKYTYLCKSGWCYCAPL